MLLLDYNSSVMRHPRASQFFEVTSILFAALMLIIGIGWCMEAWQDVLDPRVHWKHPRPRWLNISCLAIIITCCAAALLLAVAAGRSLLAKAELPRVQAVLSACLLVAILVASALLTEQRWWYPTISRVDVLIRMAISAFASGIYPALLLIHHRQRTPRR